MTQAQTQQLKAQAATAQAKQLKEAGNHEAAQTQLAIALHHERMASMLAKFGI